MKTFRVILTILCVALILCMPFMLSSPIKPTPLEGTAEREEMEKENRENAVTMDIQIENNKPFKNIFCFYK